MPSLVGKLASVIYIPYCPNLQQLALNPPITLCTLFSPELPEEEGEIELSTIP